MGAIAAGGRAILAAISAIFLATMSSASAQGPAKPQRTQLWTSEPVAAIQIGLDRKNEPYLRSIRLGVLAASPTEETVKDVGRCIDKGFGSNEYQLNRMLVPKLNSAYALWVDGQNPSTPPEAILDDGDRSKIFFETAKDSAASAFALSMVQVQTALREVDSVFRLRLAADPQCNALAKSAHLALIQRICTTIQECGEVPGANIPVSPIRGNSAARFEMLIAWAVMTQGSPASATSSKSLLTPNVPVVFGVLATGKEAIEALSSFNNATIEKEGTFAIPDIDDSQRAIERLIRTLQLGPKPARQLAASSLLVAEIPLEIGIRFAQLGAVANADFAVANSRKNPAAVLKEISDDVARRRAADCVRLQGISSTNLEDLKKCSGYTFASAEEVLSCLQANENCRPKLDLANASYGAAMMTGTARDIVALANSNILPRYKRAGFTYGGLVGAVNEFCRDVRDDDLSKCVLEKGLGNPDHNAWSACLVGKRSVSTDKSPLRPEEMASAVDCYAKANGKLNPQKVAQTVAALRCLRGSQSAASCLTDIELPAPLANVRSCATQPGTAEQKLGCYISSTDAKLAEQVAKCAQGPTSKACLEKLAPDAARKFVAAQAKCAQASAASALQCADALGIPLDQNTRQFAECVANGISAQTLACVGRDKLKGPAGLVVACYAEGAEGGPGGVAVCAASQMLGLNQDFQMLAQCAAVSGGEPLSTGTCTFGKLAMRELTYCKGKKFGEGKCFGENNTLRKALGIGPGSEVAKLINLQLDVVNGMFAFVENPGAATEAALRNAGKALTDLTVNVHREVGKTAEEFRKAVTTVVQNGVYTKVDNTGIQVGGTRINFPRF